MLFNNINRKELEPNDLTEIGICKMSMAGCLRELRRYDESEKYGKEALKILSEKYGEENILTGLTTLIKLCFFLVFQKI